MRAAARTALGLGWACLPALWAPGCGRAGPRPRPNLVLISIDALRADRLSAVTTPRLDAWARAHASVFRQAIAAAPWTLPSHASLLTGFDPLRHAANRPHHGLPAGVPTLAEMLRAHGYATAAITGGGWLDPAYGLLRGFEHVRAWSQAGRGDVEWELHAAEAAVWLDRLPQPFFLLLHTYDVHDFPRAPRPPPGTPEHERARLYDAAVAHVDAHLGPLLGRLSSEPLRSRTALVVTSDHGEALGERTAEGARDYGHGSLRDPVLRVPLLVSLPADGAFRPSHASAPVRLVDQQVRLIDVAPTLLELAGLAPPRAGTAAAPDGVSLLPLLRDESASPPRVALSYFARPGYGLALRDGPRFKYRLDDSAFGAPAAAPREALFDLEADPGETRNLAPDHAQLAAWRARARRLIEERTAGLALRLRAGDTSAFVRLRGALLKDGAPTSPAWPGPALRRVAPDAAELRLPARGQVTLLFQPMGEAVIEIESAGVEATLDVPDERRPAAWSFDGRAWSAAGREVSGGASSARQRPALPVPCHWRLCVTLAWRGGAHTARWTAPPALRPEVRERLRALGYVQ